MNASRMSALATLFCIFWHMPSWAQSSRHMQQIVIEDFGLRLLVLADALVCRRAPPAGDHGASFYLTPASSCANRPQSGIDGWLYAGFNMSGTVHDLPPIRREIARHACRETVHFRPKTFGKAPFRVAGLPTFMCSGDVLDRGQIVGNEIKLHFYRGNFQRRWPDDPPYPISDYHLSISSEAADFAEAKASLWEIAKSARLFPLLR
jgi:hypothetical protein